MDTIMQGHNKATRHMQVSSFIVAFIVGSFGIGVAHAQSSEPAQTPLFLTTSVDPNIMFTLDDSGSMQWEFMPDGGEFRFTIHMFPRPAGLYGGNDYANQVPSFRDNSLHNYYGRSAENNGVFYDPDITYSPWGSADGSAMPDADPTNALYNPDRPGLGGLDLTVQQTQSAIWFRGNDFNSAFCDPCNGNHTFWPITYYNYTGGDRTDRDSYQRVQITAATPASATFTSPGGVTRTRDDEIQNFANWFQYSRSRVLAARNGIGRAFTDLSEGARVGFGAINEGNNDVDGVTTRTIIDGVRAFSGTDREGFYDRLYGHVINTSGTPLRRAARRVGDYFERTDERGPWSSTPGDSGGEDLECRQSFHILMSDGFWNGFGPGVGNSDGSDGPTHTNSEGDSFQYTATDPFRDTRSDTLGDVAMEYWKRDLRTDLENAVPTNATDPAFWQHLATFGIGLGVEGDLDPDDVTQAVEDGTAVNWGNPFSSNAAKIDDLLHFGINGRGGFFSAADPDEFAKSLGKILREITARTTASATSAAVSAAVLETDTRAFFAGFRSTDWSGTLTGRPIDQSGDVAPVGCAACWDAEDTLAAQAASGNRNIFTRQGGGGIPFSWGALGSAQKDALDHAADGNHDGRGNDRVAWLHGDELNGLRSRSESGDLRLLGDIVNSDPVFVDGVLYVGANDGMLHAFDGETGEELFAYIPSRLLLPEQGESFAPLSRLTAPDYTDNHRFFVDGEVGVRQVHDGNGLRTILVGSLGAGGRQVFALDVSDPDNFSASDVLWEFSDTELGASIGSPQIARTQPDGDWAVFFGNGHGSSSHEARLFVLDLLSGSEIENISTDEGSAASPNGLATPFVTDWPSGTFRADRVYAGDRLGNLWIFDVSASNTNQWSKRLLARATDPGGNPQPITSRPIGQALDSDHAMISFGTGSFLFGADASDPQVQSLYGVLDTRTPASQPAERPDLVAQTIVHQATISTAAGPQQVRVLSDNEVDLTQDRGWILDLDRDTGERIISDPQTLGREEKRVRFSSLIPDDNPCGTGRRGFFMDFDLRTGGRLEQAVFDLDDDGHFGEEDVINVPGEGDVPISGREFGQGESTTSIIIPPEETDTDRSQLVCDGEGNCEVVRDGDYLLGRMNWQQLR